MGIHKSLTLARGYTPYTCVSFRLHHCTEVSLGSTIEGVIQRLNQSEMGQKIYLRRTLFLSTWGKLRTSIRKYSASLYQFNFHACPTKPAEFDLLVINQWMTVLWHFKRKPKKPSTPSLWAWFQPVLTAVSFTPDRTTWVRSPEAEIREDHSVYPIQIQSALRRYHENRMHTEPLVKSYGATRGTENSI